MAPDADGTPLPADTSAARLDSLAAPALLADSTSIAADSTGGAADEQSIGLPVLYRFVEARYPGTPYAAQAQQRRTVLESALQPEPEPADVAPVEADVPPEIVAELPPETFGLEGETPLSAEVGGYAWQVAVLPNKQAAQSFLTRFLQTDVRAAAVVEGEEDGRASFALLVGQFPSREEAEAAREALPEAAEGQTPEIRPLPGLNLLDQDGLAAYRLPSQRNTRAD